MWCPRWAPAPIPEARTKPFDSVTRLPPLRLRAYSGRTSRFWGWMSRAQFRSWSSLRYPQWMTMTMAVQRQPQWRSARRSATIKPGDLSPSPGRESQRTRGRRIEVRGTQQNVAKDGVGVALTPPYCNRLPQPGLLHQQHLPGNSRITCTKSVEVDPTAHSRGLKSDLMAS